ncbi:FecR domain-containing protein [Methylocystis sp. MJC1]|uniref:FecR domain-containing protein n=1 Tax=Methylocystis sp. MJC1 TaxID=2654282 RepID=UPI0013EDBE16|nr:FecR domain-containing protein [Methylocystis sp. MJC1]MBU6528712.1 FecR domain-containing protein [Methylocystis sp. MJC1]UZX11600.1 FecR domain-containing protein [Methylocystis sp. MJC1]
MRRTAIATTALCALTFPAAAEETIGSAAAIEKDVQGASSGRSMRLSKGDEVYFDEVLTTGAASRGKFVFADRTDLQMGPSSRVKLDNFVYAGGAGATFNAAKGAFRFVSAPGEHKPYDVRTPTATIGVRGTNYGVRVTPGRTDAVLYAGAIEVCDSTGAQCRVLDKPCTTVTVTPNHVSEPKKVGKKDWSFDNTCKGAPPPSDHGSNPPPGEPAPPPPPGGEAPSFNWSGPTIGFTAGSVVGNSYFADPVPLNGAAFAGGLKIGYMLPIWANIVAGFETDAQFRSSIGGSSNGEGSVSGSRPGYIGTARLKFGYAFDRILVYGTGGLAYGHIIAPKSYSGFNVGGAGYSTGASLDHAFLPGWSVGGGVSYALTQNISVNAEYLYIKLQHHYPAYTTSAAPGAVAVGDHSAMHGIRFGVNFGFSPADLARLIR